MPRKFSEVEEGVTEIQTPLSLNRGQILTRQTLSDCILRGFFLHAEGRNPVG